MRKLDIFFALTIATIISVNVFAEVKTTRMEMTVDEDIVGVTEETEADVENVETDTETESAPIPNEYTEDDLYVLSHIIQCEAGNCQREMMEGVGSVVLNRVADPRFPNTITEVVNQPGQYTPVASGAFASAQPTELVMEVAVDLLEWGSKFPPEVVWQANFPQGEGTYLPLDPPPGVGSTMYFCY